mmetsp:Transcript_36265/g.116320  ORF Transcript_36265/g.116320 Transcript_36265/m.116320 type:complete len:260 (-) Transcript_36265:1479-2258(-)
MSPRTGGPTTCPLGPLRPSSAVCRASVPAAHASKLAGGARLSLGPWPSKLAHRLLNNLPQHPRARTGSSAARALQGLEGLRAAVIGRMRSPMERRREPPRLVGVEGPSHRGRHAAPHLRPPPGVPHQSSRQDAGGHPVPVGGTARNHCQSVPLHLLQPPPGAEWQVVDEEGLAHFHPAQVQHVKVGLLSHLEGASVVQAEQLSNLVCHLPHCMLQRQARASRTISNPVRQHVRAVGGIHDDRVVRASVVAARHDLRMHQ